MKPITIMMKVLSKGENTSEMERLSTVKNEADMIATSRYIMPERLMTPSPVWVTDMIATPVTEHRIQAKRFADRCSRRKTTDSRAVDIGISEIMSPENDEVVRLIPSVSAIKYITGSHSPIRMKRPSGFPLRLTLPMPAAIRASIMSMLNVNLADSRMAEDVCPMATLVAMKLKPHITFAVPAISRALCVCDVCLLLCMKSDLIDICDECPQTLRNVLYCVVQLQRLIEYTLQRIAVQAFCILGFLLEHDGKTL
jgi:hypothetical protein